MSTATKMAMPYAFQWSNDYAHIAWADLYNNGLLSEIAVVKLDEHNGDLYFISLTALDEIDKQRMLTLVTKRDAQNYKLWDLMSGTTLRNGVNALEYFNQLVRVRSASGQIYQPQSGKIGAVMLSKKNAAPAPQIQQNQAVPVGSVDLDTANAQVANTKASAKKPPAVKP